MGGEASPEVEVGGPRWRRSRHEEGIVSGQRNRQDHGQTWRSTTLRVSLDCGGSAELRKLQDSLHVGCIIDHVSCGCGLRVPGPRSVINRMWRRYSWRRSRTGAATALGFGRSKFRPIRGALDLLDPKAFAFRPPPDPCGKLPFSVETREAKGPTCFYPI